LKLSSAEPENDAVPPQDELSALKEELAAREKEARENHDRYLRAAAELDNYRKAGGKGTGRHHQIRQGGFD
jgi:molecular chaperone GrpE (heat shock protein)